MFRKYISFHLWQIKLDWVAIFIFDIALTQTGVEIGLACQQPQYHAQFPFPVEESIRYTEQQEKREKKPLVPRLSLIGNGNTIFSPLI